MTGPRAVLVWDLATRAFHWLLVMAVTISYASGGEEGWLFVVHTVSGYVVALLLLFRVIWGVVGSPRSRFQDFVYGRQSSPTMSGAYSPSIRRDMSATIRWAVGW